MLPALALTLYSAIEQRRQANESVVEESARVVRVAKQRQAHLHSTMQHLLAGLTFAPEVRSPDQRACGELLYTLDARWPGVTNLAVFDRDGALRCHSRGVGVAPPRLNPTIVAFVDHAVTTGRFTVGRTMFDVPGNRPVVLIAQPVRDSGRLIGVLGATVALRWFDELRAEARLPPDATLLVVSRDGRVLHHSPDPRGVTGTVIATSELFRRLQADGDSGMVEVAGPDGQPRLHAYGRLPGSADDPGPYVAIGFTPKQVYAEANQVLHRNLLRLGAITVLALVLAVIVAELLVLRRLKPLLAATERIAGGALHTPTGVAHDDGELGRIAEALDRMLAALREREAETQRAVVALQYGEERYRSLVLGTSQIVWTANAEGKAVEDQPSWRAVTGQTMAQVLGWGFADAIHPDDRAPARAAWITAWRERRPYADEYRLHTAGGDYRPYYAHAIPLLEKDGAIREWVGFCVDLTERKAAEASLRRVEEAGRQGQKLEAVGRLAGGVAHDFNNLLTAISSYGELLLEDPTLANVHRADVLEIRRAADRAAALVRQLLAFSRRQPVQPAVLDLNDVVRETEGMLRRVIGVEYELVTVLAPDAGLVHADRGQMEQAVLNLVLNARDAMPAGGRVTIVTGTATQLAPDASTPDATPNASTPDGIASSASTSDASTSDAAAAARAMVTLAVHDDGVGMDDATRARVFEPFFTTKELGKGTGLGLATVYGAVQQAGGAVEVMSTPGRGATFTILLPRLADWVASEAPAGTLPRASLLAGPLATALVVDDEAAVRAAAARVLRRMGYQVLEAGDGEAALDHARAHGSDLALLLTDVVMPRLGGLELAQRLRLAQPSLPVIFMSGFAPDLTLGGPGTVPDAVLLDKPFAVGALERAAAEVVVG